MSVPFRFRVALLLAIALLAVAGERAAAVSVRIDYSTDTSNFFGSANPNAAQARSALEAAAQYYSGILEDTFSPINAQKFYGAQGGEASFFWKRRFIDPATGFNNAAVNEQFDPNEYVVYVGARDLPDPVDLAVGGPGGYDHTQSRSLGAFSDAENSQVSDMFADFQDAIETRGQTSGFARWGGSVAFDSLKTWHFDHTTAPVAGRHDFYTVALHELAHALGFGGSDTWDDLVSGSGFTGANALAAHAPQGNVPLESAVKTAHWSAGVGTNPVYEGSGNQTPLMVPALDTGLRRALTNLDAAALVDIGWQIDLPGGSASALTHFTTESSSSASAAVFAITGVETPEPASAVLLLSAAAMAAVHRPHRKSSRRS